MTLPDYKSRNQYVATDSTRPKVKLYNRRDKLMTDPRKGELILSKCMLSAHYCSYLEKLGQNRVGVLDQISRILKNCRGVLIILEIIQRKKLGPAVNEIKRKGCSMDNKLPIFWRCAMSWLYLIFVIVSIRGIFSGLGYQRKTQGNSCNFNLPESSRVHETHEGNYASPIDNENMRNSKETNINWNEDDQYHICMHDQMVALTNGDTSRDKERHLCMDDLMTLESGIDNCYTNHVCCHRKLF
eukprot:13307336-Ditylum_brightwellii.AAC.1